MPVDAEGLRPSSFRGRWWHAVTVVAAECWAVEKDRDIGLTSDKVSIQALKHKCRVVEAIAASKRGRRARNFPRSKSGAASVPYFPRLTTRTYRNRSSAQGKIVSCSRGSGATGDALRGEFMEDGRSVGIAGRQPRSPKEPEHGPGKCHWKASLVILSV